MKKFSNAAKKFMTGFMIVAVAVIMIGSKPVQPPRYGRPKGEDKIGYSAVTPWKPETSIR